MRKLAKRWAAKQAWNEQKEIEEAPIKRSRKDGGKNRKMRQKTIRNTAKKTSQSKSADNLETKKKESQKGNGKRAREGAKMRDKNGPTGELKLG